MGITSDEEVLILIDNLLAGMAVTSIKLMDRLIFVGFTPSGEISTLIFAAFLYVYNYNEARKDSTISESIEISKAKTFGNPILQKFFAAKSAQTVNQVVLK